VASGVLKETVPEDFEMVPSELRALNVVGRVLQEPERSTECRPRKPETVFVPSPRDVLRP